MDLVLDGADVGADGAEEAQAVACGARIDLQQHPTHRAEFHRPPPAALHRRRAPDVSVPRRIVGSFPFRRGGDKNPGLLGLARVVWNFGRISQAMTSWAGEQHECQKDGPWEDTINF